MKMTFRTSNYTESKKEYNFGGYKDKLFKILL